MDEEIGKGEKGNELKKVKGAVGRKEGMGEGGG